jgi:hypothetical protein
MADIERRAECSPQRVNKQLSQKKEKVRTAAAAPLDARRLGEATVSEHGRKS